MSTPFSCVRTLTLVTLFTTGLFCQTSPALEAVNTNLVKQINPALIKRDALENADGIELSPAQKLKIQTVMQDLDTQVKSAFKGDEALQAEMTVELKKISAIKDDAALSSAIRAYQAKYGKRYQSILAKGNINLNNFASRLNADVPEMQFNVTNNLSIKGVAKTLQTQPNTNAQAQSSTSTRDVTLGMSDFVDTVENQGCGYQESPTETDNLHYIAGDDCEILVERSARIVVPPKTKITMTINANLEAHIWAMNNMSGYALTKIPVSSGPKVEAKSTLTVPFMWADSSHSQVSNKTVTKTYTNNSEREEVIERKVAKLRAVTSYGFMGMGSSEVIMSNLSVKVKFEPQ